MRLASNKLKDIIDFYYTELDGIYGVEETEALLSLAIEHYLGYSRTQLLTKAGENVNQSALIKLYDCCRDLKKNIPLQYILKEAWFYQLPFFVDARVLIPRPETEELVSLILQENPGARSFLDIGTGSGCIPVAIKKNLPLSRVMGCDVSPAALEVANENARLLTADVTFFEADVLEAGAVHQRSGHLFEVIISNPPYIKASEKEAMAPNVIGHEPHLALFVEDSDSIIFYKKIIDLCADTLSPQGRLYLELNPLTAVDVKAYALASGLFSQARLISDMSGKQRFLKATKH